MDINGQFSKEKSINISVLQGSILGPLLFLCFINDLHTMTNLLTLLFADDTAGLKSGFNLNLLIEEVNVEINKIANWFRANKMAVNTAKTKYIIFQPKGSIILVDIELNGVKYNSVVYDDNEIGLPKDKTRIIPLIRIHKKR